MDPCVLQEGYRMDVCFQPSPASKYLMADPLQNCIKPRKPKQQNQWQQQFLFSPATGLWRVRSRYRRPTSPLSIYCTSSSDLPDPPLPTDTLDPSETLGALEDRPRNPKRPRLSHRRLILDPVYVDIYCTFLVKFGPYRHWSYHLRLSNKIFELGPVFRSIPPMLQGCHGLVEEEPGASTHDDHPSSDSDSDVSMEVHVDDYHYGDGEFTMPPTPVLTGQEMPDEGTSTPPAPTLEGQGTSIAAAQSHRPLFSPRVPSSLSTLSVNSIADTYEIHDSLRARLYRHVETYSVLMQELADQCQRAQEAIGAGEDGTVDGVAVSFPWDYRRDVLCERLLDELDRAGRVVEELIQRVR